jgi:thiol-disulfide isomerase/thioredoxin
LQKIAINFAHLTCNSFGSKYLRAAQRSEKYLYSSTAPKLGMANESLQLRQVESFSAFLHYLIMVFRVRIVAILLLTSSISFADIITDVRSSLSQNDFASADSELKSYRGQHGIDPPYVEALSWMARAALSANRLDQAIDCAKQTEILVHEQLGKRTLDSEPHLATALGAALEVHAQVLADKGQSAQAVALLRRNLVTYSNTSIRPRLQKNLNLLGLVGQPAPVLNTTQYLGVRPSSLAQLKGSPVLLFFWAHWCVDCKYEGPIIGRLASEFSAKGLKVQAPTQTYGYTAQLENPKPQQEIEYIGQVWQHYYPQLQNVPVPISKANFNSYGASTTPTLVLIDRKGQVTLYHPGVMSYEELRNAIEKAIAS